MDYTLAAAEKLDDKLLEVYIYRRWLSWIPKPVRVQILKLIIMTAM